VKTHIAFQPGPYQTVYGASKAFVLSFSQDLWAEIVRPRRRDVENPAAPSREHPGQERASQGDHRTDIDGDFLCLPLRVGLGKRAVAPKPGVVDQHLDRAVADAIEKRGETGWDREIGGDRLDLHPGCGVSDLVRRLVQPGLVAAGQNQGHAPVREPGGEPAAQPGRRSRHDSPTVLIVDHDNSYRWL
jgi:hypothetical protein